MPRLHNHLNRSIHVHLGDEWRSYARMVPVGFIPLGTVTRKTLVQAFARDESGNYWAFGTGSPEPLPQGKMQRSIAAIQTRFKPKTTCDAPAPCASEKPG